MALTSPPTKFVAGNWKMNGLASALREATAVSEALKAAPSRSRVALFPPAPLIWRMAQALADGPVEIGAQDSHREDCGAYTGDVSAEMLHDAGARLVILGHSERRTLHRESDQLIAGKVAGALRARLEPIICVGEQREHRRIGHANQVVRGQLEGSLPALLAGRAFSVAYEPIWAIGSGETPSAADIEDTHATIREALNALLGGGATTPILYGGSVKPDNAAELLHIPGVDGVLVGGASLAADSFLPIIRAAG
jgi:triosephosphate isomerase